MIGWWPSGHKNSNGNTALCRTSRQEVLYLRYQSFYSIGSMFRWFKHTLLLCFVVACCGRARAQHTAEAVIRKISVEQDAGRRLQLLAAYFANRADHDPLADMQDAGQVLRYAEEQDDAVATAFALSRMGYDYRQLGNHKAGLEKCLKANEIADKTGNAQLKAVVKTHLGILYKDLEDYAKAIALLQSAARSATAAAYPAGQALAFENIAECYLAVDQLDSALVYAQQDFEVCTRAKCKDYFSYTLLNLGVVHGRLGNPLLANSYFDMAIQEAQRTNDAKALTFAFNKKSAYCYSNGQEDSALVYARKAIAVVQQTAFSNFSLEPAKLLLRIYRQRNVDSAFKYSEIYRTINDSLFNARSIQQMQLMTFESDQREKEKLAEQEKEAEHRQTNLQNALIALGILVFVTLFLLLSHTIVVNEKVISFLAALALLLVFEFINLLIHPWLAHVTHESPVWMLLFLVLLASLLIPLHHRLEHWVKAQMVARNKKIRLAAARKTIERLEKQERGEA
jgi:tetratricopeptide (TPR) repeat protein